MKQIYILLLLTGLLVMNMGFGVSNLYNFIGTGDIVSLLIAVFNFGVGIYMYRIITRTIYPQYMAEKHWRDR